MTFLYTWLLLIVGAVAFMAVFAAVVYLLGLFVERFPWWAAPLALVLAITAALALAITPS